MPHAPLLRLVTRFFATIGMLVCVFALWLFFAFYRSSQQENRRDLATNAEGAHVLNGLGLDSSQKFQVTHSFQSEELLFMDDRFDAFCISLEKSEVNSNWKRSNQLPAPFWEAVAFGADSAMSELSCFPSSNQIATGNFLVQAREFRFISNGQIDGAEVAVLDLETKSLFYFRFQN